MLADRRRLLIGLGLVVALGVAGVALPGLGWDDAGDGAGPWRNGATSGAGRRGANRCRRPRRYGSHVLQLERDEPSAATRNPFKFDRRTGAAAPSVRTGCVVHAGRPGGACSAERVRPPPPPIPLKFIGVVEKGEGMKWAVLSVGDGRGPFHGKEGDIIDGRYRILKIGTESIEMAYLDGRGRQTIRLTGQ